MSASPCLLLQGDDPAALSRQVLERAVAALRREPARGQAGTVLWITPTLRAQRLWTRRLCAALDGSCLGNPLVTFEGFAERLLEASGRTATAISPTVRRLLLRRLTAELTTAGELPHFRGVAETAGFLDVVSAFIAELKRDEIWPEEFAEVLERLGRTSPREQELGRIYARYQGVLLEQNWYDHEGRFWLARTNLAEGLCRGLPRWSWIGVAGFNDFTYTQKEILELLADRCDELVITLPTDVGGNRPELFEKPTIAARGLHAWTTQLQRSVVPPWSEETPTRRSLREALFGNPRETAPSEQPPAITILAATGPDSELTAVALQLKAWLRAGVPARDLAVGLRSVSEQGLWWREGLAAAGLPAWCDTGPRLATTGVVKFVAALLQTEVENWPFARLSGLLGSSYLRPSHAPVDTHHATRMLRRALRELRLPEGRYEILQGIERAAQRVPRPERARELDEPTIDYALAHRWLAWYAPLTERLHRARSLEGWLDLLAELLRELGVTRFDSDAGNAPDLVAWDQAQRLLRAAATAEARWRPTPRVLNLSEFLAEFRDLLADETAEPPPEPSGAIRILGAEQLRHLETPYLILADLNEESFPRHHRDDCLFTDHERRAFAAAGLPLRHAQLHQQDELLFFTQLVLTAQRHLVLTYPAVSRRGQPAYASPYLAALRGLWTDAALPIDHVGSLDPVPQAEAAVSPTDLRLVAMEQALDGSAGWLRALGEAPETRAMVRNLVAAVEMQVHRFHTSGFTAYEGRLELARNHEQLAQRFHADRQFSATELESLAACPFRFWLDTVLNVAPLPEVDTGTDLKRRGTVVHDVLAQLLEDQRPDAERDALSGRFRELVTTALDRVYTESDLQAALLRVEGLVLSEWANAYVEQFGQYAEETQTAWAGAWRSLPPETPFGDVPRSADEPSAPPLSVGSASQRVLIRGRIDRIDTGVVAGRPVFTVIDYKTGKRPSLKDADVHAGRSLQLVLYAMAARRLGLVPADALPFQLGYWCLKETGFRGELGRKTSPAPVLDAAVWSALEQLLDETIPRLVQQIRAGQFVVDNPDEDCTSRCDYRTICRVQQLRPVAEVLGKRRVEFAPNNQPEA